MVCNALTAGCSPGTAIPGQVSTELHMPMCANTANCTQRHLAGAEDVDEEGTHDEGPLAAQRRLEQLLLGVAPLVLGLQP